MSGSPGPCTITRTLSIRISRRTARIVLAGLVTALALAYIGPVLGYFDQRAELRSEQARLASLEAEKRSILARIAAADAPEVLEARAREQGLVRPGERAFAIHGALEPEPAPVPEAVEDDDGGLFGWFPDIL